MADNSLALATDFDPKTGMPVPVAPGVVRVSAPNASPYTFTGTNSFLIGHDRVAVLDPGPDDDAHLAALLAAIDARPVEAIVLTHTHNDHSALARRLQAATGAPLWFEGPHRLSRPARPFEVNGVGKSSDWTLRPDRRLADGEPVHVGGVDLAVLATPGHCANHLAFGVAGTPYLFSGDHVMGWNSTLVSVPDGSMADYFASLEKLIAAPYSIYLPAHGGPIARGVEQARALLAHRRMRNGQILDALSKGVDSIPGLLTAIYPALSPKLLAAARMTLKAHLEYLEAGDRLRIRRTPLGLRLAVA